MTKTNSIKKVTAMIMAAVIALVFATSSMSSTNVKASAAGAATNAVEVYVENFLEAAIKLIKQATKPDITQNKKYNMTNTSRAKNIVPQYVNTGKRSAANYNKIINQFNVQKNARYKITNGSTWCNIFADDVMQAMNLGGYFSHWVTSNGKPVTYSVAIKTKGSYECNVKSHLNWMNKYGVKKYGWKKVSAKQAQQRANKGYPTLVMNKTGTHIAVVRPETATYKYSNDNVVIAQAGLYNVNYGMSKKYFGTTNLVYYTHD